MSPQVAIIGSGMAGTAAADKLARAGFPVQIFEAKSHWGGHTFSQIKEGFLFDEGPHLSFTTNKKVQGLFARGARKVRYLEATITNSYQGRWIPHPAQCHLYGLDAGLVTRCLIDFIRAQERPPTVRNYADWCIAKFGRSFAETFPFAYTRKYWTLEARQMSTDWVNRRIYPPRLQELIRGALEPDQEGDFHYLTRCRYPEKGGYQSFMRAMHRPEIIQLNRRVQSIHVKSRRILFEDGSETGYDRLISTMPLPDLIRAISQAPGEVRKASKRLLCSSLILVDIAVKRSDLFDKHWFYIYDEDFLASRVHFPHLLSPHNVPEGCGSIQAEIYHSRYRPLPCDPSLLPERIVDEMIRLRILRNRGEVLWARHREVPYANVVFTLERAKALKTILPWVAKQGILLAGRYAEWGYHWTDDATVSGWRVAEEVIRKGRR